MEITELLPDVDEPANFYQHGHCQYGHSSYSIWSYCCTRITRAAQYPEYPFGNPVGPISFPSQHTGAQQPVLADDQDGFCWKPMSGRVQVSGLWSVKL